jgi:hypothetical protein
MLIVRQEELPNSHAYTSTASEMAMPREPGEVGSLARIAI